MGAQAFHGRDIVADEQYSVVFHEFTEIAHAFLLKSRISDRQGFVDNENIRGGHDLHCERQAHPHAAGISFYRLVDKVADVGKVDDFVILRQYFPAFQAENRSIEEYVFPAGEFRIESAAQFQKRADSSPAFDFAGRGLKCACDDLEQCAFARPVPSENADALSAADLE